MEFYKQEYWNRLPFPTPGKLPNTGIECISIASLALADGFLTTEPAGKPNIQKWLVCTAAVGREREIAI